MRKFELKQWYSTGNWYIKDRKGNFMHRDGEIVHGAAEYWPTKAEAQAVLDKYQPKHDLIGDQKMKIGDKVTISDYSWVRSISHGKFTYKRPNCYDDADRQYTVVETGCSYFLFKKGCSDSPREYRSDTVIQADDGRLVFIHSRFLDPIEPPYVWKHGDVFTHIGGGTWLYAIPGVGEMPVVICLTRPGGGTLKIQLKDGIFLFNIKDKL